MTFATMTNIATMILCIAVLIQTVRLMSMLATVRGGALTEMVNALEVATAEARRVLAGLTKLMRGDVAETSRTLAEGKTMVDELTIMIGIANAIAERMVDAASTSNAPAEPAETMAEATIPPPESRAATPRARRIRVESAS